MNIKDLAPELQALVHIRQKEQGNDGTFEGELKKDKHAKNFDWGPKKYEIDFWSDIDFGQDMTSHPMYPHHLKPKEEMKTFTLQEVKEQELLVKIENKSDCENFFVSINAVQKHVDSHFATFKNYPKFIQYNKYSLSGFYWSEESEINKHGKNYIEFSQIISPEERKVETRKMTGRYFAPKDYYGGIIKKGELVAACDNSYFYRKIGLFSERILFPVEIVKELFTPEYEPEIEKIFIGGGYEVEFISSNKTVVRKVTFYIEFWKAAKIILEHFASKTIETIELDIDNNIVSVNLETINKIISRLEK